MTSPFSQQQSRSHVIGIGRLSDPGFENVLSGYAIIQSYPLPLME